MSTGSVYPSIQWARGCLPKGLSAWRVSAPTGALPKTATEVGGMYPPGMHSCHVDVEIMRFLLLANKVWGKVMFSQVFICPGGGGGASFPVYISGHMTSIRVGVCLQGGLHPGRGGLDRPSPIGTRNAGGMHPTGMLSCFAVCLVSKTYKKRVV